MRKMKVISLSNQKGGVAKTTTSTSLAKGFADEGKKVLLIDSDKQANTTDMVAGIGNELSENFIKRIYENDPENPVEFLAMLDKSLNDEEKIKKDLGDVLMSPAIIKEAIIHTKYKNLDLVPASLKLGQAQVILSSMFAQERFLNEALRYVEDEYDYVIIDNAPDIDNAIWRNSIYASDLVLVPVKIDRGALKGVVATMKKIIEIHHIKPNFEFKVFFTMMNNNKIDKSIYKLFEDYFNAYTLMTKVRFRAKPATEASLNNQFLIDSNLNVSDELKELLKEVEDIFNESE